jgi:Lon protease-like protein
MRSDVTALSQEDLRALPVFPLPHVVFFPGSVLPLHLFEPRYRAMARDCMTRGPRAMAVVLLRQGWQPDYEGRPPIHSIAGAGRIGRIEERPDGTFDLELHGVARVALEELAPGDLLYRRAQATVLADRDAGSVASVDVTAMVTCASRIAAVVHREHPEFSLEIEALDGPGSIADRLTDRLIADPDARQKILETLDVGKRVQLVTEEVADLLARIGSRGTVS